MADIKYFGEAKFTPPLAGLSKIEPKPISEMVRVGPFSIKSDDASSAAFAHMLMERFGAHAPPLGLEYPVTPVEIEEIPQGELLAIIAQARETFSPEHAKKFNLVIHGAYRKPDYYDLPSDAQLVYHGTDATRGSMILAEGFKVPEQRKVDLYPMYGTGGNNAYNISKAGPYFNEGGYSSKTPAEGIIYAIVPDKGNAYQAISALWGDIVTEPDGNLVDWRTKYDSIETIPKGAGGDASASNFPELTLKNPAKQAHIVAALWAELIPAGDPRYDPTDPLRYEPVGKPGSAQEVKKNFLNKEGFDIVSQVSAKSITGTKAGYEFTRDYPEGLELNPGQAIVIDLPHDMDTRALRTIVLAHRKNPKNGWYADRSPRRYVRIKPTEVRTEYGVVQVFNRTRGWIALDSRISHLVDKGGFFNERDSNPAKTRVYAHDPVRDSWVLLDTKIGEPRPASEPEEERLYNLSWRGPTDKILLVGAGEGDPQKAITSIHSLEVVVYPDIEQKQTESIEQIFVDGVRFYDLSDPSKNESTKSSHGWGYYYALQVGSDTPAQPFPLTSTEKLQAITKGAAYIENGKLHLKLPPGKTIKSFEVACGDTVYGSSRKENKAGWARLTAVIHKKNGSTASLITDESVPPNGILSGATEKDLHAEQGDEIIVEANGHPAWIMGYRILCSSG